MKTEFDKIYCINFLERPDRRHFMQWQFERLGLDVTFYNAINYNKIFNNDILNAIKRKNERMHSLNIFGCAHSHYSVIKESQLLGYNKILIMEDDMCFIKNPNVLEEYFNNLPSNWDFIKYFFSLTEMGGNCSKEQFYNIWKLYVAFNKSEFVKNTKFINFKYLPKFVHCSNGACLYALSKKCIDHVVSEYEKEIFPADGIKFLFEHINGETNLNRYLINKTIAIPSIGFTIGYADEKTMPKINSSSICKYDRNDFYYPGKLLKSTLCVSR